MQTSPSALKKRAQGVFDTEGTWQGRWWKYFGEHTMQSVAFVGVFIAMFWVPQVSHVLWGLPSLAEALRSGETARAAAFVTVLVGAMVFHGLLAMFTVPGVPADPEWGGRLRTRVDRAFEAWSERFYTTANGRRRWLRLVVVTVLPCLLYAGASWLPGALGGGILFGAPLLALLGVLTFTPEGIFGDESYGARAANVYLRVAVLGLLTGVLGDVLWVALPYLNEHAGSSWRVYTVWAYCEVFFWVLAFARALDLLVRTTATRVTIVFAALVAGTFLDGSILLTEQISLDRQIDQAPDGTAGDTEATAAFDGWLDAVTERLNSMGEGPVLLVAASGGGARAAIHAALTFELLSRTNATSRSPDSPAGARPPPPPDDSLARHVLFVSSVSGGSVASAYFVAHRTECDTPASDRPLDSPPRLQNGFAGELWDPEAVPEKAQPYWTWALGSTFVDKMFTDFTAPAMHGFFAFGPARGGALADFWAEELQLSWPKVDSAAAPGCESRAPAQLLVNATTSGGGDRVVASDPVFPAELLASARQPNTADEPRSLGSITLAHAVRLSASFPWGMNLALAPAETGGQHAVIDGGVLDNTGVDTLAVMLERLREIAESPTPNGSQSQRRKAHRLLAELRSRGVLLVEIDSGARPSLPGDEGRLRRAVWTLLDPLAALERSAWQASLSAKEGYYASMFDVLGSSRDGYRCFDAVRVPYSTGEDGSDDAVMTAWTLGANDKKQMIQTFVANQEELTDDLEAAYDGLATHCGSQSEITSADLSIGEVLRRRNRADLREVVRGRHTSPSATPFERFSGWLPFEDCRDGEAVGLLMSDEASKNLRAAPPGLEFSLPRAWEAWDHEPFFEDGLTDLSTHLLPEGQPLKKVLYAPCHKGNAGTTWLQVEWGDPARPAPEALASAQEADHWRDWFVEVYACGDEDSPRAGAITQQVERELSQTLGPASMNVEKLGIADTEFFETGGGCYLVLDPSHLEAGDTVRQSLNRAGGVEFVASTGWGSGKGYARVLVCPTEKNPCGAEQGSQLPL